MIINKWQYGYMREKVIQSLIEKYGYIVRKDRKEIWFKKKDEMFVSRITQKHIKELSLELCEEILKRDALNESNN